MAGKDGIKGCYAWLLVFVPCCAGLWPVPDGGKQCG